MNHIGEKEEPLLCVTLKKVKVGEINGISQEK